MDYVKASEVDVAYDILSQRGTPVHYKELIMEVIDKKRKPVQSLPVAISEVYTLINMDSRFQYVGESLWGLTEWNPPETKRAHSSKSSSSSSASKGARRREKLLEGIQEE